MVRQCMRWKGSAFVAGAAVQWLRDQLGIISNRKRSRVSCQNSRRQRWCFCGTSIHRAWCTTLEPRCQSEYLWVSAWDRPKGHIARATLEGVAMQIYDILNAMSPRCQTPLQVLKLDGGMAKIDLMMQFQPMYSGRMFAFG